MTREEAPTGRGRRLRRVIYGVSQVRVTLVTLLAVDVLYRVVIRAHVRRAIGI